MYIDVYSVPFRAIGALALRRSFLTEFGSWILKLKKGFLSDLLTQIQLINTCVFQNERSEKSDLRTRASSGMTLRIKSKVLLKSSDKKQLFHCV